MSRYFFHNVYGDADELLASKPNDVIAVPFGWDEEAEYARNLIIADIGVTVSCLPSVFTQVTNNDKITGWVEFRFEHEMKPWSWDQVPVVAAPIEAAVEVPAEAPVETAPVVEAPVEAPVEVVPEISPDIPEDAEATA